METETHKAGEVLEAAEAMKLDLEQIPERCEAFAKYVLNIQESQVGVIGDKYSDPVHTRWGFSGASNRSRKNMAGSKRKLKAGDDSSASLCITVDWHP